MFLIATSTVILVLDVPSRRLKRSLLPRPAVKVAKLLRRTAVAKGVAKAPRAVAKAKARNAVAVLAKVARRAKCMRVTEDVEGEDGAEDAGTYEAGDYEAEEAEANSLLVMPVLLNEESVQVPTTSSFSHSAEGTMCSYTSLFDALMVHTSLFDALMVSQVDTDDSWSWVAAGFWCIRHSDGCSS